MKALRLASAYHVFTGETPGKETRGTYFDQTQAGRPYHLDYCFIPEGWAHSLTKVRLGRRGAWSTLSDHVPLTVELDLE
jgi:endonuclease/exonuclease/phosphatase family metal-dependent hydrolase